MSIESQMGEKPGEDKRDETLKLSDIDTEYLERLVHDQIENFQNIHEDFFEKRRDWITSLRDLQFQYREGTFENASDLHIPYSLIMSKAMHAKIFQIFSQSGFFSVEANNIAYKDQEELVTRFMMWVLQKWTNRGRGKQETIDAWVTEIVDEGSGILKLWWDRWEHTFIDLDVVVEEEIIPNFFRETEDDADIEVGETENVKAKIENKKKTIKNSAPRMGVVGLEDFFMPPGYENVQDAPWIAHQVFLKDEDIKLRVKQKKFDEDVAEEILQRGRSSNSHFDRDARGAKEEIRELEGISRQTDEAQSIHEQNTHAIIEWYGKAYVDKDVDDELKEDMDELPQEIVVWYHRDSRKLLGWTYLHRISPSGKRPFYKADFMPSRERAFGVGVAEMLFSLNNHIDAVHNLKLDNGMLSSMQFGVYRSGSTFKPDTFKINPGDLIPVEDVDDFKWQNIPYLGQFGENEELSLTGYGEKLLAINDINLGNLTGRGVAGSLRNATGANFIDRQANIQMHPHIDRIARELQGFLSDIFLLCRSRMSEELLFRVTGEDGKGVFEEIRRDDLRGDFDFQIPVDAASASDAEKQQRATLMLQTLMNPQLMQMGLVQPGNLYEVLKEYLVRHQIRNPETFLTKPTQHAGPALTPEQRIFKIMMGQGDNPPIEQTVRPDENHAVAIATYEQFKESDLFGAFDGPKVAALQDLIEAHQKFVEMLGGGAKGIPNMSGTQMPGQGGLGAIGPQGGDPSGVPDAGASEGGPLGSPEGEPNGPVS